MSASPKEDVEQAAESPPDDPDAQMNPDQSGPAYDLDVKEQDRWLPIANVARIMKMALPENAKIAKEAKECMQECVSEFIAFVTSEASEKCHIEKRKTVNGEDILFAMTSLGFENYAETLKIYLSKYRESQASRGENRPGSQGFGSNVAPRAENADVNVNANADTNLNVNVSDNSNTNATSTSTFPGNEASNTGILAVQGVSEQDSSFEGLYRYQITDESGSTENKESF